MATAMKTCFPQPWNMSWSRTPDKMPYYTQELHSTYTYTHTHTHITHSKLEELSLISSADSHIQWRCQLLCHEEGCHEGWEWKLYCWCRDPLDQKIQMWWLHVSHCHHQDMFVNFQSKKFEWENLQHQCSNGEDSSKKQCSWRSPLHQGIPFHHAPAGSNQQRLNNKHQTQLRKHWQANYWLNSSIIKQVFFSTPVN